MGYDAVFKYNMPSGIPGAISRAGGGVVLDVEPISLSSSAPFAAYGVAGQVDGSGNFRALNSGDTTIFGFLSRPFPFNATTATGFFGQSQLGTAAVPPQSGGEGAVMRAGYMTVLLQSNNAGSGGLTVIKGGQVYVCIQNPPAGGAVGGVTGAADGGNTITCNATFTGPADSSNNVEIEFNVTKG